MHTNSRSLTEKGVAAQAEYTVENSPASQCIPPAPPITLFIAGLLQISMPGEHILIRAEFFRIERLVYMDGREHPQNGERTSQGHSIGWWEDDVLVIDTTNFADHRNGIGYGVPTGAQKHLVERYELTEDGIQLKVEYVLDDPEYLQESATGGIVLDHASNETFMLSLCDPETAQRWMFE